MLSRGRLERGLVYYPTARDRARRRRGNEGVRMGGVGGGDGAGDAERTSAAACPVAPSQRLLQVRGAGDEPVVG